MGLAFSCVAKDINVDRVDVDMTPLKNRNLPIVWISGQQNTGKKTHGNLIKEKFDYEHFNTTELLRQEATNDTERGAMIKDAMDSKKKIPDDIIIDLLKEALLNATTEKGFVISNFPKNSKQAMMFIKEIGEVSFILYLYSDTSCLISRAKERTDISLNEDILTRDIIFASRDIKLSLMKFTDKIENINTHDPVQSVFGNVERVFMERLQLAPPIAAETDYVQEQNNVQEEF